MGKINILSSSLALTLLAPTLSATEPPQSARFSLDDPTAYIEEKTTVFSMNKRTQDPFGKPKDPHTKIVKKAPKIVEKGPITEQQVLIAKEITALGKRINVIGSKFLIENRLYRKNEKLTVRVKNKDFPLKISSIHKDKITFIDLSDGTVIDLDLNNGVALTNTGGKPTFDDNEQPAVEVLDPSKKTRRRSGRRTR